MNIPLWIHHTDQDPMTMTCQSNLTSRIARLVAMAIALLCSETGKAQVPAEMQGVGVNERLDEMLPLDLEFTDPKATGDSALFYPAVAQTKVQHNTRILSRPQGGRGV